VIAILCHKNAPLPLPSATWTYICELEARNRQLA
jgi:hypothetical protein